MQISNCTVSKVKSIIRKLKHNDDKIEITDADIISFLENEENITLIQEQSNISFGPSWATDTRSRINGLDTIRAR